MYDKSGGGSGAQTLFLDTGGGYFLKSAAAGALAREAGMTRWFHGKGLSAKVLDYLSGARDWLLT
jgi:kanamycin kinase